MTQGYVQSQELKIVAFMLSSLILMQHIQSDSWESSHTHCYLLEFIVNSESFFIVLDLSHKFQWFF